jgi:hypothetical protein
MHQKPDLQADGLHAMRSTPDWRLQRSEGYGGVQFAIGHLLVGISATYFIHKDLYYLLAIPIATESALYFLPKLLWMKNPKHIGVFLRLITEPIIEKLPDADIRCALFRTSLYERQLFEVARYTARGIIEKGRKSYMNVSQGVAGRAYRTRKTCHVTNIEDGQWEDMFMENLGFTKEDLGRFANDRKCYLCVPCRKKFVVYPWQVLSFYAAVRGNQCHFDGKCQGRQGVILNKY